MDLSRLLLRLAMLARRRPTREFVYAAIAVAVIVALCLAVEALGWWPEGLTVGSSVRAPRVTF